MLSPGWATRLLSRYWLLLPLLVVVVVGLERIETPAPFVVEETIDMRQTQSDYYLADFRSQKFTSDGELEYTVEGDTLAHYPHDDRSEIVSPRVELHRSGTHWQISSHNGVFNTEPDLFTLAGDVVINRAAPGSRPVTIRTSTLTVAIETNEVLTDAPIQVSAPTWHLQATGMKSTIDDGKLSLLADVVGRYEIPGP